MSKMNSFTIKTKLIALALALVVLIWTGIGVGVSKMQIIGDEIVGIVEQNIPLTAITTTVVIHRLEQAIHFERAVRYGEELTVRPQSKSHFNREIKDFDDLSGKVMQEIGKADSLLSEVMASAEKTNSDTVSRMKQMLAEVKSEYASYTSNVNAIFHSLQKGDLKVTLDLVKIVEVEERNVDTQLQALLTSVEKLTLEAGQLAEHDEQAALQLLLAIGVIATVLAFGLSFPIINSINQGISRGVQVAKQISSGDLSRPIQFAGKDEIAQLLGELEKMRVNLSTMVTEMNDSSTQLASAAEELSVVTGETNQNIHIQSSEIDQVVTAINEMSATVQEVALNASSTSSITAEAQKSTQEGQKVVQQTVGSINDLASEIERASEVINRLETDSESISGILDVIKNIAEQTNLLALNAAIEAARAGEQGRGFAVVADEVRTLASRTQESTLEIEEMIEKLQKGSRAAVTAMVSSKENANISVEKANEAGVALRTITDSVSTISDMNTQIASAAEEQSLVTEEINRNISNVNEAAVRTATGAEQTMSSSEELAQLATNLNQLVMKFRVS